MSALHLAPCGAMCATAAAERRARSATVVASCSAPAAGRPRSQRRHHGRQRQLDTCCAAARDAGTQSFPQPGETMDFPPNEMPRQSEEAQLATVPRPGNAAPLGLPPFEGAIAAQFPDTALADVEQVYQTFNMHGCTFYIAVENDMLRLDDIHVEDHDTKQWRRPPCSGEMPQQAALYQQVPWVKEKHGDFMKMKENVSEVLKVFLIRRDPVTQMLDFDTVVALDAEQQAVAREEVARATDETDPEQLSLRIREGHISLELTDAMPSFEEVVRATRENREPEGWSEDPHEAAPADMDDNEMDDDFDAPDIPAIDFA